MEKERPMYEALAALPPEARKFFTRINLYRIKNELDPLRLSPLLTRSAQGMADDMKARNWAPPSESSPHCQQTPKPADCGDIYWHVDSRRRLPAQRNEEVGYTDTTYGENLAAGYPDAESVFHGWRTSTGKDGKGGHNANMLKPNFCVIGIALVPGNPGPYWVTDFGGRRDQDIYRAPPIAPGTMIIVDGVKQPYRPD